MAPRKEWFGAVGTAAVILLFPLLLSAQSQPPPELKSILDRLDRLEQENRSLAEQVRDLRAQLAAARGETVPASGDANTPTTEERLDIQQQRIEEQAQTKVEASQKFPIRLTGMALFNTFLDSRQNGGVDYPTVAFPTGPGRAGATFRQTIVGLEFHGPQTFWGGTVRGSVFMDFASGASTLSQTMRLRTGSIELDWKTRNILVGVEKPIFNPREPSSLAQVAVSPLTGVGNLWLWVPQVRLEQDVAFGPRAGLRARMGVVETREVGPYETTQLPPGVEAARPALEGRYELFYNLDSDRRLEIAPGFHTSTTHASGFSIPSNLFSLDWLFIPWRAVEFTGAFFNGENVANLGTGAINEGYAVYKNRAWSIDCLGLWGQFTVHAAPRLDVHAFTGRQNYGVRYLSTGDVSRNAMFGANLFYRIAPNVLLGPEFSQLRSIYIGQGVRINNHYDFALAYLF
ncbi:conserved exported hypothetical protein [Candidatus Sulfopaludibacter sp. SbA3]|nr:conserved exported hypothetical protein [Candidatus Sulfopaludibacter sp. SbA3]